jgi:hypothetical protein
MSELSCRGADVELTGFPSSNASRCQGLFGKVAFCVIYGDRRVRTPSIQKSNPDNLLKNEKNLKNNPFNERCGFTARRIADMRVTCNAENYLKTFPRVLSVMKYADESEVDEKTHPMISNPFDCIISKKISRLFPLKMQHRTRKPAR